MAVTVTEPVAPVAPEMEGRMKMAEGMMSPSDVAVMMNDRDGWGSGMGFM